MISYSIKTCAICQEFLPAYKEIQASSLNYLMIICACYYFTMIILAQEGSSSEPRSSEYTKTISSGLHRNKERESFNTLRVCCISIREKLTKSMSAYRFSRPCLTTRCNIPQVHFYTFPTTKRNCYFLELIIANRISCHKQNF